MTAARRIRLGVSGLPLGNRSGTGTYTEQLLRVLSERGEADFSVETLSPNPEVATPFPTRIFPRLAARWPTPFLADRLAGRTFEGLDLVHFPNAVGPPVRRIPTVATLHDVSPFSCPETLPAHRVPYLRTVFANLVRTARILVTDTHWQAERILEIWPNLQSRLRVVHPPVDPRYLTPPGSAEGPDDSHPPYLLMVGSLEPRKRVELAVEAWERSGLELDLRLVGRWGWKTGSIRRTLDRLGPPTRVGLGETVRRLPDGRRIHHLESASPEQLRVCYRNAVGLIYPSRFEGFGLPILEAMALGCPVVTRRGSAMEEVAGPAGWYFEGESSEALSEVLESLCANGDLRRGRIEVGLERSRGFDDVGFYEGISEAYRAAIG